MGKKSVSAVESGAGFIGSLASKLVKRLRQMNVSDEDIYELVKEGEASDTMVDIIANAIAEFVKQAKKIIYTILVDYAVSIEEMVRLGKYDWANSDITTGHFPTKRVGKAEMEVELIHFNRSISSEEALKEMDKMGYRAAEAHELLAFGAKYPDVQREFPIVALGSVWRRLRGYRRVVCLGRGDTGRGANLIWFEGGWYGIWRFVAVRK